MSDQRRIVVVGPLPPPIHGVSAMTELMGQAVGEVGAVPLYVDTADRRGIENIGRLDIGNVTLGLRHTAEIWSAAVRSRPAAVILPISQFTLPLLRDALWALGPLASGARLILHLHGAALTTFYASAPAPARAVLRWLGRRAWRGVVLTEGARHQFDGIVAPDRIRVLPNTVPDPGSPTPRARDGRFRALYLSNLVRGKGYIDLITAADRVVDDIPDLEVVLAGAWYDGRDEAERLLASPRLQEHVRLAGVVSGVPKADLLRSADVFVFPPSQLEGQPLVLLEAMAAGLPIITTGSGLIPETIVEGRNALVVPSSNPGALADAMGALRADPELRQRMSAASRAIYLERYTPEQFRHNLRALLAELPGRR